MTRREIMADFAAHDVTTDDGLAYRTDDQIERLWRLWEARDKPRSVVVGIDAAKNRMISGGEAAIVEMFAEECLFWIRCRQPKVEVLDVTKL